MTSFHWGQLDRIPEAAGVYWLSYRSRDVGSLFDADTLRWWVEAAPAMTVDGVRAEAGSVQDRLAEYLQHDVVYIGSSNNIRRRLWNCYIHIPGDDRPHRGSQWLKTLAVFEQLEISYEATPDYSARKNEWLQEFMLQHPGIRNEPALPFANLTFPDGTTKNHGIGHVEITPDYLAVEKNPIWRDFKSSVLAKSSQYGGGFYQAKINLRESLNTWGQSPRANRFWAFLAERDSAWIRRSLRWSPKGGLGGCETTWRHVLEVLVQAGLSKKKPAAREFLTQVMAKATLPADGELVEHLTSIVLKSDRQEWIQPWIGTLLGKISAMQHPLAETDRIHESCGKPSMNEDNWPQRLMEMLLQQLPHEDSRRQTLCEIFLPLLRWEGLASCRLLLTDAEKDDLESVLGPIQYPQDLPGIVKVMDHRRSEGKSTAALSQQLAALAMESLEQEKALGTQGAWRNAFDVLHAADVADAVALEARMVEIYLRRREVQELPDVMKRFLESPRDVDLISTTFKEDLSRRKSAEWALSLLQDRLGKGGFEPDDTESMLCQYVLSEGAMSEIIRLLETLPVKESPIYLEACQKMIRLMTAAEPFRTRMKVLGLLPETMDEERKKAAFQAAQGLDITVTEKDFLDLAPYVGQMDQQDIRSVIDKLVAFEMDRTEGAGRLIDRVLSDSGSNNELRSYMTDLIPMQIKTPLLNQLRRKIRRDRKIYDLETLEPVVRLAVLADTVDEIAPNYFPESWAEVPAAKLQEIPPDQRIRLADLLTHHKHQDWKNLRQQLIELGETRAASSIKIIANGDISIEGGGTEYRVGIVRRSLAEDRFIGMLRQMDSSLWELELNPRYRARNLRYASVAAAEEDLAAIWSNFGGGLL